MGVTQTPDGILLSFKLGKGKIGVVVLVENDHAEGLREVLDGSMVEFAENYQMILTEDGYMEIAGPGIALRGEIDVNDLLEVLDAKQE